MRWSSAMAVHITGAAMVLSSRGSEVRRGNAMPTSRRLAPTFATAAVVFGAMPAAAQPKYDPGASDGAIKVGNIMPYSGPLSAYAIIGKTQAAYFKKINDEGGIN